MTRRCASFMVNQVKFRAAVYFSVWESVELHSLLILLIYCTWNCDSEICKRVLCFHVCLNFQVWFQFLIACLFQAHRKLESWKNSGYSLNHQCLTVYSRLHKRIALNFSTLMRQIQYRISLTIQGSTDCLSDIKLMNRILRHGSCIPSLPEEYSQVFPRWGMTSRYTSI
jgi:hypothetical protein